MSNKIRKPASGPLTISHGKVARGDGGVPLTLGIAMMPSVTRGLKAELNDIEAWMPDIVVVLDCDGAEEVDDLTMSVGDAVVHVIDSDTWPVAQEDDLLAERREIICNVLFEAHGMESPRILVLSARGDQAATTLATELLLIAGVDVTTARQRVNDIHPGYPETEMAQAYLDDMPEARARRSLALPFSGGWVMSLETRGGGKVKKDNFILRADGMHVLKLGTPGDFESFGYAPLQGHVCEADAPVLQLCAPQARENISLTGANRIDALKILAQFRLGAGLFPEIVHEGNMAIGPNSTIAFFGMISEEAFRSMPQAGF